MTTYYLKFIYKPLRVAKMSNNCIPKMMSFSTDQLINILKSYNSRSVSQPPLLALDQHMPLFNSKYILCISKKKIRSKWKLQLNKITSGAYQPIVSYCLYHVPKISTV